MTTKNTKTTAASSFDQIDAIIAAQKTKDASSLSGGKALCKASGTLGLIHAAGLLTKETAEHIMAHPLMDTNKQFLRFFLFGEDRTEKAETKAEKQAKLDAAHAENEKLKAQIARLTAKA